METATKTAVHVVSKTKMAIATAFLGFAALAAAGAGGNLVGTNPCAGSSTMMVKMTDQYKLAKVCRGDTVVLASALGQDHMFIRSFSDSKLYARDKVTNGYTIFEKGQHTSFKLGSEKNAYVGYYRTMGSDGSGYLYVKLDEQDGPHCTTNQATCVSKSSLKESECLEEFESKEACEAVVCQPPGGSCADEDACTEDYCNPQTYSCKNVPMSPNAPTYSLCQLQEIGVLTAIVTSTPGANLFALGDLDSSTGYGTYNSASSTVDMVRWQFSADEKEDIEVESITVQLNKDLSLVPALKNFRLIVGGQLVAIQDPTLASYGKTTIEVDPGDFVVNAGESIWVVLQAHMGPINTPEQTGQRFSVGLVGVEAEGKDSKQMLPGPNLQGHIPPKLLPTKTVYGNEMVFVQSRPYVKVLPSGSSSSNKVSTEGEQEIFRFSVRADDHGSIHWAGLNLKVEGKCAGTQWNNTPLGFCLNDYYFKMYQDLPSWYDSDKEIPISTQKLFSDKGKFEFARINFATNTPGSKPYHVAAGSEVVYYITASSLSGLKGKYLYNSLHLADGVSEKAVGLDHLHAWWDDAGHSDYAFIWSDNSGPKGDMDTEHWFDGLLPAQYGGSYTYFK